MTGKSTYAEILNGDFKSKPKLVFAHEEDGIDWLNRSVVGRLLSFCDVNSLQNLFISNEIWDAHIRSLGGLNVLITFESKELMEDFLKDKNNCLPKWFSSVEVWQYQRIKPSRCVWISCFGVPINAWNNNTFINIVVYVKMKDESFPVKVVEDPCAETSWENRIVTNIKVKRGMEEDGAFPLRSEEDSVAIVEMNKISKEDAMADTLNSNLKDQKFDSLVADTYDGTEKGSATEVKSPGHDKAENDSRSPFWA
ncbi:hypothetical protein RHGRI_014630 [Rhododendron griersonianum]|uniref:DUF4283 domain-containing protein n=1 Tax=Rhododendron griersonianum TaxID=479676 RepID=A0AAV6KA37_9ERIC|nr:hypothetical protein RHGRI_014630 [Rhododendron griersonianum]